MIPLIRRTLLMISTFALAFLAPLSAPAREIRHPETGLPAYTFILPDDWTTQGAADGNLILFSPNRTTGVALFTSAGTETLDAIAAEALKVSNATATLPKQPTQISGLPGYTWFASMKNPQGVELKLELTIIQTDPGHVASATLLMTAEVSPADEAAGRAVRNGVNLESAPAAESVAVPANLPDPVLVFAGLEYYKAGGKEYTRYKYNVENLSAFPDELFAAAPDLPPCGSNTKSARTWVDFYADGGKRLYGFCAFQKSADLGQLWFAVATDEVPPASVYIELNDRRINIRYKSNLAPTSRDPRLK